MMIALEADTVKHENIRQAIVLPIRFCLFGTSFNEDSSVLRIVRLVALC